MRIGYIQNESALSLEDYNNIISNGFFKNELNKSDIKESNEHYRKYIQSYLNSDFKPTPKKYEDLGEFYAILILAIVFYFILN